MGGALTGVSFVPPARPLRRAIAAVALAIAAAGPAVAAPRLVLQITVDQLRGDLPLRCRERWGEGGFRRLYDHGVVFTDAHFGHANTETVVGHATLATGADPSVHGLVGNSWYDRTGHALQQNVDDSRYALAGNGGAAAVDAGHAGAGAARKSPGRSPSTLLAPTIADSVAVAGRGRARVFSVSLKDRAAVPMGGHDGKAFWWSDVSGEFVSSTYYFPDGRLPGWAQAWNRRHEADRLDGTVWSLKDAPSTYRFVDRDDQPWESPPAGLGRTFPHRYERARLKSGYYAALAASPFGDDLVAGFFEALLQAEEVGRDDVVDYVSVSLSSSDYIGHRFGPDSLEMEDQVLRVDRVIARLLDAADAAAGRGRTLVVLSADHGVAEPIEQQRMEGHDSGRIALSQVEAGAGVRALERRFGGPFVAQNSPPCVYLDNDALARRSVDPAKAARSLAGEIAKTPGVQAVFTRERMLASGPTASPVERAVRRSYHPVRSGDLYVLARPGWQIAHEGPGVLPYATGHGTPWDYDSFVPLVLAGAGLPAMTIGRRVDATDVAPTVAALAGVAKPALASGHVLLEWRPAAAASSPR